MTPWARALLTLNVRGTEQNEEEAALHMSEKFATNTEPETFVDRLALRDVFLVALTVASGAVDAISYFGLGKIFSAFMTGNIVFLGFGIAEIEGPDVVPVMFAIATFAAGSYLGLRIATQRSGESGPWPPAMTVLLALVATAEGSFLVVWLATGGHPPAKVGDVLIILFSLAMGIQTAAVRSLGVQGVFTTAGTFTLVAFAGTFTGSRSRAEMPRLAGVLAGLIAGAVGGGLLFLHARSYAPILPLAITVLVIMAGRVVHRTSAEVHSHRLSMAGNRSWARRYTRRSVESEGGFHRGQAPWSESHHR
jgi:uncharacterized membrane protein YoaK (UPF0700 family)